MEYYFIPTKIAIIKKTDNTKCWQGCRETGSLIHFGDNEKWYTGFEKESGYIPKGSTELPRDPAILPTIENKC